MKIGIVCPYNIFRHGGVQEQVFAHKNELKKRGHAVLILTPRPIGYEGTPPEDTLLIGISTDLNYPFKTKADVSFKAGSEEIRVMFEQQKFDVLHFHEPWVPLFSRQLLNQSNAKHIATFHAKWPEKFIYRVIGRAARTYTTSILKKMDFIAATSIPASVEVGKLVHHDIPIIPNGIDTEKFDRLKVKPIKKYSDGVKTIVYINRLEKRKGPDLLLKAYRVLTKKRKNVRLVLASDGDMRQELESYAERYDLPNVEFLGFIDENFKLKLYRSADLYCAPSPYGEGWGIVLFEAMSMQTPYLAGDNAGYRAASAERADDYLVNPNDTEQFANKLERMLFDASVSKEFAPWARNRALQYDFSTILDKYEHIYSKLLEDHD